MEINILFLIVIISAAILLISISISVYLVLIDKKLPETYNCYIFSILWTPTSCETKYNKNYECFQKIKELNIEKYFTIHGLWPTSLEGIIEPPCNKDIKEEVVPNFDFDPDYKLKMGIYWPGLYNNNTHFWKHEYNKHGYCYMKRNYLNFIDDYKRYFDKGIELFEGGYRDLMENILPDSKGLYNISKAKFRSLLKYSKFNLTDDKIYCLMCDNKTNLLSEIYFLYDLNFKPVKQKIHQENCKDFFLLNFTDETKLAVWEKYDFYVFSIQYSPNICVKKGNNCIEILKKKEQYKAGIHGLWPSYKSGVIPQECNLGEDIQIIVEYNKDYFDNYILKHWYSLYNTDDYFLTHEYNKHGFCYNKYIKESTDNFYIYLNKTMEIFFKYNFSYMFDNIIDNLEFGEQKIKKKDLLIMIEKLYPKNSFTLRCKEFQKDKLYLEEIQFKLDKNFEFITDANLTDSCYKDEIWFNVINLTKIEKSD